MTHSRVIAIVIFLVSAVVCGQDTTNDFHTETVTFTNGDIQLNGKLYLPHGEGPFPAVIFTHGSGPAGVDNSRYNLEAEYFAQNGIISLLYDKRGSGESTGDWRKADYADLAQDAIAAVNLLKSGKQLNVSRIGLRGISQSGWILPIVAKESKDVDFLILISPPGVTTNEQIIYDVRTDLEDLGYGPTDVAKGLEVIKSGMTYARSLDNWERHQQVLEKYKDEKWINAASGPPVPEHWLWSWVNPVLDFDSVPLVHETQADILVILGEKDRVTPSQIAGYRFEKELQKRNGIHKVVYFPNAGHDLRVKPWKGDSGEPPLVDGYLELMKGWVKRLN